MSLVTCSYPVTPSDTGSHPRCEHTGLMHTNEFRQAAASLDPRGWIINLGEKESKGASNMPGSKQSSPRDVETHPKIWREKSEFVLKSTKKKVPAEEGTSLGQRTAFM